MKILRFISIIFLLIGIFLMVFHFTNKIDIIYGVLFIGIGSVINTILIIREKVDRKRIK